MFIKIHTEYCTGELEGYSSFLCIHIYINTYGVLYITMFSRQNLLNQKPFVTMNTSNTTFLG
jgi:hypothetical protein